MKTTSQHIHYKRLMKGLACLAIFTYNWSACQRKRCINCRFYALLYFFLDISGQLNMYCKRMHLSIAPGAPGEKDRESGVSEWGCKSIEILPSFIPPLSRWYPVGMCRNDFKVGTCTYQCQCENLACACAAEWCAQLSRQDSPRSQDPPHH